MEFTDDQKCAAMYSCYLILCEIANGGYTRHLQSLVRKYDTMLDLFGFSDDIILSFFPGDDTVDDYLLNNYVKEIRRSITCEK